MGRLTNAFVGRDTTYFDLFEAAARNLLRAAELLEEMLVEWPDSAAMTRDILVCEQEGDRITHDLIHRLNQTFVTPIDREDILELASKMDDVADYIEEGADYFALYKIEATMTHAQRLAEILTQSTRQICEAMPRLRTFADLSHYTIEIHRLENDGDRVRREGMAALFETGIDPMTVIRWKDIYDRLEAAIDATEQVANILESIVIKNS